MNTCAQVTACSNAGQGGTLSTTADLTCDDCAAGQFAAASDNECIICAAGHVTDTLVNPGGSTCTACAAGKYSSSSTIACITCPAGKGKENDGTSTLRLRLLYATASRRYSTARMTTCETCTNGTIYKSSEGVRSGKTVATSAYVFGHYVSSNVCIACAAGKTNAAGNDVSGSDTSCTATLCAENEYVSSHVCTGCAAGKTNAADNDASGSDQAMVQQHYVLKMNMFQVMYVQHVLLIHQMILVMM